MNTINLRDGGGVVCNNDKDVFTPLILDNVPGHVPIHVHYCACQVHGGREGHGGCMQSSRSNG
jgi:hypothetical protein